MERFNFKVFRRFWAIARTYWFGEDKWKARGLLLLIVLLLLGYTGLSVLLNTQRGELISALSAKSESRFWTTVGIFLGILVVYAPLLAGYTFLRDRLGLAWRRWLTDSFIERYFRDRAFYNINQFNPDIDNPDQRIAEDVRSFTQESLALALVAVESVLSIIAFSGVLWGISRELVLFLVIYAVVGTVLTIGVFGQPLVKLNFEQLKKEANFRFSLVRVRENAEAIAFYQGEGQESSQIKTRFMAAFDNYKKLLNWELALNGLTNFYEFIPFVLPAIVVAPGVFSGDVEVGKVSEAQGAFIRVFFSLNVIVARLQTLTAFGAGIDRLYDFSDAIGDVAEVAQGEDEKETEEKPANKEQVLAASFETVRNDAEAEVVEVIPDPDKPLITFEISPTLTLQDLTLQTPNYQRTLIENLSLTLDQQGSLLVMGPSGCGKSSLMRAIAGLWESGTGTISKPTLKNLLFLPQKPYMVLGSLKQQMLYPYPDTDVNEQQLIDVLKQVNLPDLADRYEDGFETIEEWGDVLSLGEQQRLSFARVLIHQPTYAILDEATSALDKTNEAQLYEHLSNTHTAYISVGHHESLEAYHKSLLQLAENHTWKLTTSITT
ncbi:MAG: ABC transporter ATP-binding protein/permease [Cyanobacteria bacterium P01_F01_bin.53]